MIKCKVHDTTMKLIEVERGKTIYVCEQCEKEKREKLASLFEFKSNVL